MSQSTPQNSDSRTAYRTCPLCEATCGLEIQVEGDRVTRVRGDRDDVFSQGYVCPKGTHLHDLHEDPDRLRRPLVKRDGEFVPVSWDEAWAEVARGFAALLDGGDRNGIAIYLGNPNVHNMDTPFYTRPLIKAMGTKNVYSASTVDQMPKHVSSGLLFGDPGAIPVPDIDRCEYLLMLGANPLESNGSLCTAPDFPGRLKALRRRGGKLVVVDPRRTRTAELADEHVPVRPGSDALLLTAMIHCLFDEDLVTPGSVAPHLVGAEEVGAKVEPFTPERVSAACGIPAETIRRLARELAAAPKAAVYGRIGTHTVEFGTLASWAADVLNILTGNLDREGGAMFPNAAHSRAGKQPGGRGMRLGRWKSRVRNLPEVRGELPAVTLVDEVETPGEGQVKALVTIAGNPALSIPGGRRLADALPHLDFMVSVDIYLNETTRHADVILPPPSPLERSHFDLAFASLSIRNVANYSPPVFEAEGPSEAEILARLTLLFSGQDPAGDPAIVDNLLLRGMAEGMVHGDGAPAAGREVEELLAEHADRPTPERILDMMLRAGPFGDGFGSKPGGLSLQHLEAHPHGVDLGALEARVPEVLSTPSAKIELAADPILEDLERLAQHLDFTPDPDELLLIGRRHLRSNNSWLHNLAPLVRGKDRCTLQVHPDDAQRLGLADGDRVKVSSRSGVLEAPVEVCDEVKAGVVSLPHGWGHGQPGTRMAVAAKHAGVNSNELSETGPLDPLSGNAVLNGIPVRLECL